MKRFALALGLASMALAGGTALADAQAPDAIPLSLSWQLSIDAQGHVAHLQATPDKRADRMPQVRAAVEKKIRGWQFVPGSVDGQPQATETVLSVSMTLLAQQGDDYQIRIDDARTGAAIGKTLPPRYPTDAVRSGASGLVVMHVDFDGNGKVTAAQADTGETKAGASLVKAALDGVKTWTFLPERVGGHGIAGSTLLPVCFQVMPVGFMGPNAHRPPPCAWTPPGHRGALAQGESIGVDPVAKLATDVVDHTL